MPPDNETLAQLVADARLMPAAFLPRPRTASPVPPAARRPRRIDLTATQMQIPAATAALMDGYDDYGA